MAADSPEAGYQNSRERLKQKHDEQEIDTDDYELITEFLDAKDAQIVTIGDSDTKSYSTLKSYCYRFMWTSIRFESLTLSEAATNDVNRLMSDFLTGRNEYVDSMANATVRLYQSALRSFYKYHTDLNVDPEKIAFAERENKSIDSRDMFSDDDINAMRSACPNTRDRAMMELLLNTGQRVRAIQTLRIKDVDLENDHFYLNTDESGLKGAEGKRPLLGASTPVSDWLDFHPTGDPEDYVITGLHAYNRTKGDVLSRQQIRRRLQKIADEAGVEKPVNPHQWRHYCVTMLKRDYDMDNDTIKWLIGHSPDSKVMETTYSHLSDQDYIEQAEQAVGMREKEKESPLTPPKCWTCGEPLGSDAKACSNCGEVFTPDAQATKDGLQESAEDKIIETDSRLEAELVQSILKDIRNNPEYTVDD